MSAVLDALISTADTSAASYSLMSSKTLARRQREVLDVAVALQRESVTGDASRREIQARYELVHGKRIDSGAISSTVHALVSGGSLVASRKLRECHITGKTICPVFAPAQQASLIN